MMGLYGRQMDTERGLYYLELREGISDQIQVILSGSLTGNTFYFKYSQEIQNLVPITFLQSKVYQRLHSLPGTAECLPSSYLEDHR